MVAPTTGDDHGPCAPEPKGDLWVCRKHGGYYSPWNLECQTDVVLGDVKAERARQFARYGSNTDLDDGTGEPWLLPLSLEDPRHIEASFRTDYEVYEALHDGKPTWMHLVREEVAEAFAEEDPARLRAEIIQIAALCVSWAEKIDAREFLQAFEADVTPGSEEDIIRRERGL